LTQITKIDRRRLKAIENAIEELAGTVALALSQIHKDLKALNLGLDEAELYESD